jgi:hypothetical protein
MFKALTLLLALTACAPAYAGERVENDSYALPDLNGQPANVHIICFDIDSIYKFLDTIDASITIYQQTGKQPNNCAVFFPIPIPLGEHNLDHLFVTNNGVLYGMIKVVNGEDFAWTYIGESLMVKGKEGTF